MTVQIQGLPPTDSGFVHILVLDVTDLRLFVVSSESGPYDVVGHDILDMIIAITRITRSIVYRARRLVGRAPPPRSIF